MTIVRRFLDQLRSTHRLIATIVACGVVAPTFADELNAPRECTSSTLSNGKEVEFCHSLEVEKLGTTGYMASVRDAVTFASYVLKGERSCTHEADKISFTFLIRGTRLAPIGLAEDYLELAKTLDAHSLENNSIPAKPDQRYTYGSIISPHKDELVSEQVPAVFGVDPSYRAYSPHMLSDYVPLNYSIQSCVNYWENR